MIEPDNFINIPLTYDNLDRFYHRTSILNALKKSLPYLSGRLLDAGCGKMPYRDFVLQHSKVEEYVGLDIEAPLIYSHEVKPDITWDGATMPIADCTFECVIATEVMEHVPEPDVFLFEVTRVLKNKGVFFFTVPFIWPLHEIPHDEYRFTPFAIERILKKNGLKVIEVNPLGGWHASMAQMLGLWLTRGPMSSNKRKILTRLFFPFYKFLIKQDAKIISDSDMITGLYGIATKDV